MIYRAMFWTLARLGRPVGGIPPRRLTLWLARSAYGDRPPSAADYRWRRGPGGLSFLLHPYFLNDAQVIAFGTYEPILQRFIASTLAPGMVCVDVGANVGLIALPMARHVGTAGTVYALEPVPYLFAKLQQNITRNGLGAQVKALKCAASSASGTAKMETRGEDVPNQGLSLLVPDRQSSTATHVASITLDDLAERDRLTRLDLIKVDVQGAESLVLEGAINCLRRFGPDLLLELSVGLSPLGRSPRQIVEMLEELGYGVFELTAAGAGNPLRSADLTPEFSALNVLCRRARRAADRLSSA